MSVRAGLDLTAVGVHPSGLGSRFDHAPTGARPVSVALQRFLGAAQWGSRPGRGGARLSGGAEVAGLEQSRKLDGPGEMAGRVRNLR
ncbi:hypothetical protein Psi02_31230 [Planotetraspora silvatica]|uniref:Uncharacterized protein n=1 Tax=Planotetraspora silvatica TaxID=234614 RepID=A0A8J3XMN7_9ACTN|nr:hypothetical protein Psi02_31230 [Planotetraspora silvatica]